MTIFVLITSTWLFVSAQTSKAPLTHETMWLMKHVGAPVPSPDGKWVVFSLVEPAYDEKDQVSDLWIAPRDGNDPRRLYEPANSIESTVDDRARELGKRDQST